MAEFKGVPSCNHMKADGRKCGSPALSGRNFCYYHVLYRQQNKPNKKSPRKIYSHLQDAESNVHRVEIMDPFGKRYTLGPLEDAPSIQVAISTVVNALADNRLDITRASTLLYGLQLAATNLRAFANVAPNAAKSPGSPATPADTGTYAQVPVVEELGVTLESQL